MFILKRRLYEIYEIINKLNIVYKFRYFLYFYRVV